MFELKNLALRLSRLRCSSRNLSTIVGFLEAQEKLKLLKNEPGVETKLKLYALSKQATEGDVKGNRPTIFDFEERAKYDAWKALGGLSKNMAEKRYAEIVSSLFANDEPVFSATNLSHLQETCGLSITARGNALCITLDRPTKYNALTLSMYEGISNALRFANTCNDFSLTILTGKGDYYCSGNDLSSLAVCKDIDGLENFASRTATLFENFIRAFIEHEKPLLVLVNGPAVGIAVTTLPLADYVLASDKATFQTPFSSLGISPEGCSIFTFPLLMGPLKSAEMLLFGRKIDAQEAFERNLVNEVVSADAFTLVSQKKVNEFSRLPPESLRINKKISRSVHMNNLLRINRREVTLLKQRWTSKDCLEATAKFFSRA